MKKLALADDCYLKNDFEWTFRSIYLTLKGKILLNNENNREYFATFGWKQSLVLLAIRTADLKFSNVKGGKWLNISW